MSALVSLLLATASVLPLSAQAPPAPLPLPMLSPRPPAAPVVQRVVLPFARTSFWNAPLGNRAPLDPNSAAYVAELRRQVAAKPPWVNTTQYSTPVYTVGAHQPPVRVTIDQNQPPLQQASLAVPIPPGARPAAGTDHTIVIWQPSTDTMWEYWLAEKRPDGWHAAYGGRMNGVSSNPGYFTSPPQWGATATSLPALGGLIRLDELEAGHIDHALAIAIQDTRAGVWSWPAQRTDGRSASPAAIPEGTRFRLDPSLDLDALDLPWFTRLVAEAAQRYGMVVRDTSGNVVFYAEDPTPTGTNPYSGPDGYFGDVYPSELLASFPWDRLQTLPLQLSGSGG
jgi:hypothetical protein